MDIHWKVTCEAYGLSVRYLVAGRQVPESARVGDGVLFDPLHQLAPEAANLEPPAFAFRPQSHRAKAGDGQTLKVDALAVGSSCRSALLAALTSPFWAAAAAAAPFASGPPLRGLSLLVATAAGSTSMVEPSGAALTGALDLLLLRCPPDSPEPASAAVRGSKAAKAAFVHPAGGAVMPYL